MGNEESLKVSLASFKSPLVARQSLHSLESVRTRLLAL